MNPRPRPRHFATSIVVATALTLSACGSDDDNADEPAPEADEPAPEADEAPDESGSVAPATSGDETADITTAPATSGDETTDITTMPATSGDETTDVTTAPDESADVAAAEALVAPYTGQPSEFPIVTPLAASPAGKRIAYLDCGTPICALFGQVATPAFEQLGMEITILDSGFAADSVQQAFDTVLQDGYDGVFVAALPGALWERGLEQLNEAGVPVVTTGVINLDRAQVPVQLAANESATRAGQLMAADVIVRNGGDANVVFFDTPELDFTNLTRDAFVEQMAALCPDCTVRSESVPVATFGTSAADLIVADLQANPDTTTAVFGIGEQTAGLTAALDIAGLEIETILNSPGPADLEGIQNGNFDVGLGTDLAIIAWTAVDSLARLTTGEEPAPGAVADASPNQFLTADDLEGDLSRGWSSYPDFTERFDALWAEAG